MNINETIDQIERGMGGRVGEDIRAIIDAYRQMEAEVARCHARLEIDHHYVMDDTTEDGMRRVEIPYHERAAQIDGIECREATIEELERVNKLLVDRAKAAEAECKRLENSRDGYARKSDAHEKIAGEWQNRAEKAEGLLADAYGADTGMLDLACRAEAAEAKLRQCRLEVFRSRKALGPFAFTAEWDIDATESDDQPFRQKDPREAIGGIITVGHFRAALKAMESTDG